MTDLGTWDANIIDTDNNIQNYDGTLIGLKSSHNLDLTKYIQDNIPIDDLIVFGELWEDDL